MWYLAVYTTASYRMPAASLSPGLWDLRRPTVALLSHYCPRVHQRRTKYLNPFYKYTKAGSRRWMTHYEESSRSSSSLQHPLRRAYPSRRILGLSNTFMSHHRLIHYVLGSQDVKQNRVDCKDIIKLASDTKRLLSDRLPLLWLVDWHRKRSSIPTSNMSKMSLSSIVWDNSCCLFKAYTKMQITESWLYG